MNHKYKNRAHKISFKLALSGLILAFKTQPNLKIMMLFLIGVVLLGLFLSISYIEWLILLLVTFLVFIAEMVNTSIEAMVDLITTEWKEDAKTAKDIASGMVLTAVIASVIIGVVIFVPKLMAVL